MREAPGLVIGTCSECLQVRRVYARSHLCPACTVRHRDSSPAEMLQARRVIARSYREVISDAEHDPHGWVIVAWAGDLPLYLMAQDALKAGVAGLRQLSGELVQALGSAVETSPLPVTSASWLCRPPEEA